MWGATKTVRDSLSPTWNETFSLDLLTKMPMGGPLLPLRVEAWDEDDKDQSSGDTDRLGHAELALVQLWSGGDHALAMSGDGAKDGSRINVRVALVDGPEGAAEE